MAQQSSRQLTQEELGHFEREGYLRVENLFDAGDLQPVIDELQAEVSARARAMVAAGDLSATFEEAGFERQLSLIGRESDAIAVSVWNGVLSGPAIFHLIANPKLLDIAEQLCGPELIASSVYRIRPKVPGHRMSPVPWHQDSGYFEPYCDRALVLTVWLPLVDANEKNGCLWVLPKAHRGPVVKHVVHRGGHPYLEIEPADLPKGAAPVCVPVKKGGALLLTNRTPHASFENNTDAVRWSMDLRYQSAKLPTNAAITRLPEELAVSGEETVPGACYPPEADFLVRSALRPEQVVRDAAEFHRIRTGHRYAPVTARWADGELIKAQQSWTAPGPSVGGG